MNDLIYLATQVPSGPRGMDSPYMLRRLGLKAYEHKFTKGFQHRKDEMHVQVRPPRAPPNRPVLRRRGMVTVVGFSAFCSSS